MAGISKQRETANEVIAAFNAWDIDRIIGFRSEDCVHELLPLSLSMYLRNTILQQIYSKKCISMSLILNL